MPAKRYELTCKTCGTSYQGRKGSRYCSRPCVLIVGRATHQAHRPQEERTCPICATVFIVGGRDGRKRERTCCSTACGVQYRKAHLILKTPEKRECPACHRVFFVGGRAHRRLSSEFCSRLCHQRSRYQRGRQCRELTIAEAAYIAGFIDGEGTIHIYRQVHGYCGVRVTVVNTVRAPIAWMVERTGIGTVFHRPPRVKKHRISYWWQASAEAATSLLHQIRPYLLIKGAQADVAMDLQARLAEPAFKADKQGQQEYYHRMHALNARGHIKPVQLALTGSSA